MPLLHCHDLADGGLWISDDRMQVMLGRHGVHALGWHGCQPVSRNARVLDAPGGVLCLHLHPRHPGDSSVLFDALEWNTAHGIVTGRSAGAHLTLECRVQGSAAHITLIAERDPDDATDRHGQPSATHADFDVSLPRAALVRDVQGERQWSDESPDTGGIRLRFRDRMTVAERFQREGPYAGDFLIPESWRRTVFARTCRSGQALADDLHPEYRLSDIPIHDSESILAIDVLRGVRADTRTGGASDDDAVAAFSPEFDARGRATLELLVRLAPAFDPPPPLSGDTARIAMPLRAGNTDTASDASAACRLHLPGYPEIERFFASVPSLLESCVVRDFGIPRASAGVYYWIWAWDAMVSAPEAVTWGRNVLPVRTARFINAHRDDGGAIPMRWTRELLPLDTPPGGGLDALFLALVRQCLVHAGDAQTLIASWPFLERHERAMRERMGADRLFASRGFYPDLPEAFGRGPGSAVSMECGLHYCFLRMFADAAQYLGQHERAERALRDAGTLRTAYRAAFFDSRRGFIVDAVELPDRMPTDSYPLFALMPLEVPYGHELFEGWWMDLASFVERHHLRPDGFRTLPAWDRNARSESVSSAWYPHWDRVALQTLRRGKRLSAVEAWLDAVERTLGRLGYCPEFLDVDLFDRHDAAHWRRHGAASTINGVTAWHRGVLESVLGLELRDDGIDVHRPVDVAVGAELRALMHLGDCWDVSIHPGDGDQLHVFADGVRVLDPVIAPAGDGRRRTLDIHLGAPRT